jgi:hypothetical protein
MRISVVPPHRIEGGSFGQHDDDTGSVRRIESGRSGSDNHARPPSDGHTLLPGVPTEHPDVAGRRPDEVEQEVDGRRFARAVRPQEAEDLALGDLEVEVADGRHVAETLGDVPQLDRAHGTLACGDFVYRCIGLDWTGVVTGRRSVKGANSVSLPNRSGGSDDPSGRPAARPI